MSGVVLKNHLKFLKITFSIFLFSVCGMCVCVCVCEGVFSVVCSVCVVCCVLYMWWGGGMSYRGFVCVVCGYVV